MGKREKRPERRTSDLVLAVLGLFILAFEVCMIALFCRYQAVPDTLIQYTLGAGGIEAVALAGIRISKELSGQKNSKQEAQPQENSEEFPAEELPAEAAEHYEKGA